MEIDVNVYHIIDHEGYGTIHQLLIPLCERYKNHFLLARYFDENYLSGLNVSKINNDKNCIIIIHSTGKINTYIMNNFYKLFPNKKIYIFFHTSFEYQKFKKRDKNITFYKSIENNFKTAFLVPSLEVYLQYKKAGLKNIKVVQLGIDAIEKNNKYRDFRKDLSIYYNKVITTCSSENKDYLYIKGIDKYAYFIQNNNLYDMALIAGIENNPYDNILSKKFDLDDFLNVLYHSKAYVQFSKYESYNITAIQAKRFKLATFLQKAEGNNTCMNGITYKNFDETESSIIKYLKNNQLYGDVIKKLYIDSLQRESLEQFKMSIENLERND